MSAKRRFYFLYKNINDIEPALHFMRIKGLPFTENLVWDEENPDYLVATDGIFFSSGNARRFRELALRNTIEGSLPVRIFFSEESVAPDLNIFDYAVCWDRDFSYKDRVSRIPPYYFYDLNDFAGTTETLSLDEAMSLLRSKRRFCNFLYTNKHADPFRDKLFHALSEYKRVDSLGSHLNNVNTLLTAHGEGLRTPGHWKKWHGFKWLGVSVRIKSYYKFSIASENAFYNGYTTEKILSSFVARTVPIYWGNPYVAEEYNPEAFVNCHDYDSLDGIVKRVKEIDENDELWAYMVSRPIQTEEQIRRAEEGLEQYRSFMTNIFTQPLDKAIRRPHGGWMQTQGYRKFFNRGLPFSNRWVNLAMHPEKILGAIDTRIVRMRRNLMPKTDIDEFFKD